MKHWELVAPIQPSGEGIPLFLVAPGPEAISLVRYLGAERPVFGVRLAEAAASIENPTVQTIASRCASAILQARPNGPYSLAGWCSAGVVALEIARQLEQSGAQVGFAALFDARTVFLPRMPRYRTALVRGVHYAQRTGFFLSRVWAKGFSPVRVAFNSRAVRLKSAGERIVNTQADDPVAGSLARHRPAPWNGRVVHIWAAERPRGWFRDPEFLWRTVSPLGFQFYEVPGDHNSMLREPRVGRVAMILERELRRAQLAASGRLQLEGADAAVDIDSDCGVGNRS